jgi:ribosomal-protein-alanine N-acetyltransferase
MDAVEIRRMKPSDLDRVMEIERDLFSLPWSRAGFLYELSDNRMSCPLVAVAPEGVIGYAVAWFVVDELHIGNVAVVRERQGTGIAGRLLEWLFDRARRREMAYATLEVRVSNTRAINFYRRYGFGDIALRKGYYTDNGEDALVMLAEFGDWRNEGGTSEG